MVGMQPTVEEILDVVSGTPAPYMGGLPGARNGVMCSCAKLQTLCHSGMALATGEEMLHIARLRILGTLVEALVEEMYDFRYVVWHHCLHLTDTVLVLFSSRLELSRLEVLA